MFIDSSFYSDAEFAALPRLQRDRVSLLVNIMAQHQAGDSVTKAGGLLSRLMRAVGCSKANASRMYYAYRESGDWRALCDKRSLAPVMVSNEGAKSPRFREYVTGMLEKNQRSVQAAIADIHDAIKFGYEVIPGLEDWPLASGRLPSGCSESSLRKLVKRHELAVMKFGLKSAEARAHDPMVLKTRVGVPVGAVYELDDMWHDHLVVSGGQAVRVLEFGAIDYASACRIHWGNTPHVVKDDGKRQGLTQEMFVLFVAYLLRYVGFAASGLALHTERGTAALPESVVKKLECCGLPIRVVRGRMTGAAQAKIGGYKGQIGGNPRAKALIENSHSGIHNMLADLPGQVGKDRQHTQESSLGRVKEQEQVELWRRQMIKVGRHDLAAGLENHLLTAHQFNELLIVRYKLHNARTDHELEGWGEYTEAAVELSPGHWVPVGELTRTPLLREQIACGGVPVREQRLSPMKVWQTRRPDWAVIPMSLYLDILSLTKLCNRTITVKSEQLVVQDKLVGKEKLVYSFDCIAPNGRPIQLDEGVSYQCLFNPYAPNALLVTDERGRVIAEAPLKSRVRADDDAGILEQSQRVQERKAVKLADAEARWGTTTNATRAKNERNRALAEEAGLVKPLPAPRAKRPKKIAPNAELDDILEVPLKSRTRKAIEL